MKELKKALELNPGILLSKKRTRGLISDIFQGDPAKTNLMMSAFDLGLVQAVRLSFPIDALDKLRYVRLMTQQYSVVDEKAKWAVDTWTESITSDIIVKMSKAEKIEAVTASEMKMKAETEIEDKKERQKLDFLRQLQTREDTEGYYINPTIKESSDRIFVPCGVGNTDAGFFIYGIKKALVCNHPDANVYALVYNYLIRNSIITDEDIPNYLKNIETTYDLDYRSIFRYAIILLQMIKNNYLNSTIMKISLSSGEDVESFNSATRLINDYLARFSRLMNISIVKLQVNISERGHKIAINSKSGIYAINNTEIISNAREIWYGRKINYHLNSDNLFDVEYILSEISMFNGFREGQYSALCSMLASKKSAVCIMPTGSGKSLIYYLASLLQPLPLFIVVPTEILICDQIRNLKKFHHFDNVSHLQLTQDNSFKDYEIHNSLNYITPMTFQNRHILSKCRYFNNGTALIGLREESLSQSALLSYIVLDEIHCLSNWGHDFRPEYLMLSRYLNKFLDRVTLLGFTATADYTVVEDVQRQLEIPQDNFYSPIPFEKNNISYNFCGVSSTDEMYDLLAEISKKLITKNQRTIVFTKSDKISRKVADIVGYEADVFSNDNPSAYYHFVDGKCKILVASEELGVGINFPNIKNIIHFGLPLSKCEYVQEVGRAGRAYESVISYVIFLKRETVPNNLLMRNTSISELSQYANEIQNDFSDCYGKLTNHCNTANDLYVKLVELYEEFENSGRSIHVYSYDNKSIDSIKQMLFMLFTVGYINDWYSYGSSKEGQYTDIMVDVSSTNADLYRLDDSKMTRRMREHLCNYFEFLGNDREGIAKTNRAESREEIISVYVDWYYGKYLYHHNEQFLDLYEFIEHNVNSDNDKITSEIKDYFVLPFSKLKSDELYYSELSLKEIADKAIMGISKASLANVERINSNRYSIKLDFLMFCVVLKVNGDFDIGRFNRIISRLSADERKKVEIIVQDIYGRCEIVSKLGILRYLQSCDNKMSFSISSFINTVYEHGEKDLIYYGIMAKRANEHFCLRRKNSV